MKMRLKFFGPAFILALTWVVALGTYQWATATVAFTAAFFAFRWAQLAQWVSENVKEDE